METETREHRSEVEADGHAWRVEASAVDGRVTVEVVAASQADGTVTAQLVVDGDELHLAMLEDIARELQSSLCGAPRRRRPGAYRIATIRRSFPRAYVPWSKTDEKVLVERWDAGDSIDDIARALERGPGGVRSRLLRLGLIEEAG